MPHSNRQLPNDPMLDDDGSVDKPHLPKWLFWDVVLEEMDWQIAYEYVIERILERAGNGELEEIIRFYGRDTVLDVLKNGSLYLMDCNIKKVCAYFELHPEELRCYRRKKERGGYWP